MDAEYTANHFYHFVGRSDPSAHEENYLRLCKILSDKEIRHKPFTPNGSTASISIPKQVNVFSEELIFPTVTCFSDIPTNCLQIHMKKYGVFGLSISRRHLVAWGARPVLYWPFLKNEWNFDNYQLKDIWTTYLNFRELVVKPRRDKFSNTRTIGATPESEDEAIDAFVSSVQKNLMAYIKPFDAERKTHELENFYMEREWRRFGYLTFNQQDVGEIVVSAGYRDRIVQNFPEYESRVRQYDIEF